VGGLKILAFCDYFSEDASGGSERAAIEVYRRLAAAGAAIRVITTLPKGFAAPKPIEGLEVRTHPLWEIGRPVGLQAGLSMALFTNLAKLAEGFQPDVIHANTLFFQTTLAAALIQRSLNTPLVTTAQIAGVELLPPLQRVAAQLYERTVGSLILRRSARLIAVSESVRRHLVDLGAAEGRIAVVPNGVDLDRFSPKPESSDPTDPPRIAFVGRLIPNKGPDVLIEALLELRQLGVGFKAVFLGDGPMRAALERRAAGLGATVEFRGQIHDVSNHLHRADLLIRPSLTEGLPLAVLEGMACRVCVIASDIPGNSDLIKDGENGRLVPPKQPAALAAAIRALLRDSEQRRRMAAAGYATAQGYGWDRTASATGDILVQAARGTPRVESGVRAA
jgi:glycosyltransferase involved in cell wall biosynthesis